MKGLLLKDFYNTRRMAAVLLSMPVMIMAVFFLANLFADEDDAEDMLMLLNFLPFVPFVMGMLSVVLTMNSASYDETSNHLCYALTTPISRKNYLNSKYLLLAVYAGVYVCFSALMMLIFLVLTHNLDGASMLKWLGGAVGAYAFTYLTGVCFLAFSMKYTAIKMSSFMGIFYMILAIGNAILLQWEPAERFIMNFVQSGGVWVLVAGLILILICIGSVMLRKGSQWLEQRSFKHESIVTERLL